MKSDLQTLDVSTPFGNKEAIRLQAEIEKLENKLKSLQSNGSKNSQTLEQSFKQLWSSIKKGTLLLVGARSAFLLLRQGMQSAIQANENLQSQQNITSNAIGQIFVPAMKMAQDAIQYTVIGIALLIKMFTGYDALAKVTTANINKATEAAKRFNKQLTSQDEITNLNNENTGLGISTGLAADLNALEEFNKKVAQVQELFDKLNVQSFVDKLKEIWDWVNKNREKLIILGTTLGIVFGASKIATWVGNLGKLIGVGTATGGTGLTGVWILLGLIAAIEIGVLISQFKELMDVTNQTIDAQQGYKEAELNCMKAVIDVFSKAEKGTKWWNDAVAMGEYQLKKMNKEIQNGTINTQEEIDVIKEMARQFDQIAGTNYESQITTTWELKESSKNKGIWGKIQSFLAPTTSFFGEIGNNVKKAFGFDSGGVVTKPTFSVTGEYQSARTNPEIISPQSLMYETMLDAFSAILPSMNSNSKNGDTIINVNGRELARVVYDDFKSEEVRRGSSNSIRRV